MPTFNLLREPWLPVRWTNGDPSSEIGLRDALLRAAEIEELVTDNPLETIALNRLLAALVAAVYPGAVEPDEWFRLWQLGHFETGAVDAYLARFADHFDLLDSTRPFLGHPQPETAEVSPLARLRHAATSGNNAVLFSHDLDGQPQPLTAAEAARAVVCAQAASLGGGVAKPFNFSHAPLVGGAFFWLRGEVEGQSSLFRALLLNLPPTTEVWGDTTQDAPTWESIKPVAAEKRKVGGIRELFTFQSRRLLLTVGADQVTGVRYNQGSKVEELLFHDPHLAYKSGKDGDYALRLQAGRALWRDSTTYLLQRGTAKGGHAPRTLEWLSRRQLRRLGTTADTAYAADVFGLVNDQAKVELWRQERVTIYPAIIADTVRWQALRALLNGEQAGQDDATKRAERLRDATRAFATRARLHKSGATRLGDVERAERDAFVRMLDTESRYWLALGRQFDRFLARIAAAPIEELDQIWADWQIVIRDAAKEALHAALDSIAQNARTWQALADADTVLQRGFLQAKPSKSSTSPTPSV